MTTRAWATILLLGLLACSVHAQSKIGFYQILSHLGNFQGPNGGFRDQYSRETADATSSALLLSSLYGLNSKINTVEATNFLTSLQNKDGGYGQEKGSPSDIHSTRNALVSFARLGSKIPSPDSTAAFLKSTMDKDGLFANRPGEKGDLRDSALALESYELLAQKPPADAVASVKDALKKAPATFGDEVADIYYGVLAASLVGYDIPKDKFARALLDLQSPQGLFSPDTARRTISYTATADALLALNLLGKADSVNVATLRNALRYIPLDLDTIADAHAALAVTKSFRDNFVIQAGGAAGKDIVEGTSIRPSLNIVAREGGVPHSGFQISSKNTFHGKEATRGKLTWNQDTQGYSGESLASTGNFGPFESVYTLAAKIPGFGPISFDVTDVRNVGYGIVVVPKATIELSGRDVKENEQVTFGTDFTFSVALSSNNNQKLVTGEYVAGFSVLDSSNVIIHQSTIDGVNNKEPITFSYKLDNADVPAGQLSFKFDVAARSGVAHTTRTINYYIAVSMVASSIVFEPKQASYKIGETVKVSFEPSTFPDLRTANVVNYKDYKGSDASSSRHFFLDVKSPQGALLRTIEGESTKSSRYAFAIPVEATFASIGVNMLSFRYQPASGPAIELQNFDTTASELYEDTNGLSYIVKADLAVVDVTEKPKTTDLVYGDNVAFRFRVKDNVSGKYVTGDDESTANVFLELQNQEKGKTVTSVNVPATSSRDYIVANWTVNPNAQRGKGTITLSVQDADGKKIALKDAISLGVTIGGELRTEPHVITTNSLETTSTAFVVEVALFCKDKPLRDAQLFANVVYSGDKDYILATLPVAHNEGRYSVSWSAPHKEVKSGTYKVSFIREVDRQRAAEVRDKKDHESNKLNAAMGEREFATNAQGYAVEVDPIFTIVVPHSAPRFTKLPVKAEFIALIVFASIVVWLINKRSSLK